MRMLEPGLHLSVGETHRLIAQARRLRSGYLRTSIRQFRSWVMRRWSRNRPGGKRVETPGAEKVQNWQATSPADTLRPAA